MPRGPAHASREPVSAYQYAGQSVTMIATPGTQSPRQRFGGEEQTLQPKLQRYNRQPLRFAGVSEFCLFFFLSWARTTPALFNYPVWSGPFIAPYLRPTHPLPFICILPSICCPADHIGGSRTWRLSDVGNAACSSRLHGEEAHTSCRRHT